MTPTDGIVPVDVFHGLLWEAEMVRSLLENAGVPAFVRDGYIGTLLPASTAPGGAGAVSVFVANHDLEQARAIVDDFERSRFEVSDDPDDPEDNGHPDE